MVKVFGSGEKQKIEELLRKKQSQIEEQLKSIEQDDPILTQTTIDSRF